LWSVESGERSHARVAPEDAGQPVRWICCDSGGTLLFTGHADGTGQLWDVQSGSSPVKLGENQPQDSCSEDWTGHTAAVSCAEFLPGGDYLVTCGRDGRAFCWDAESGDLVARLGAPTKGGDADRPAVEALAVSPDGSLVVTGAAHGSVCLYRVRIFRDIESLSARTAPGGAIE
jgi:ribosome assembly protein SQT1